MGKLRFQYSLTSVVVFCFTVYCSTVHSQTFNNQQRQRDEIRNRFKDSTTVRGVRSTTESATTDSQTCILPPITPDKSYTVTCPAKQNCATRPGEPAMEFTVLMSKCSPGYAQYIDGGFSTDNTIISVCYNGTWAANVPKCKKICNKLSSQLEELDLTCSLYLDGPRVPCNSILLEGAVVVPRCKPQYLPNSQVDYRHVTCQADGTWDKEFFQCSNDCGRTRASVVNLIANGFTEKRGEAPWFVAIYSTVNSEEPQFICGGTLVSTEFVVSGAICFYDQNNHKMQDPRLYTAVVGKRTVDFHKMDYSTTKKYSVKKINVPEDALTFSTYNSDLALVQLSEQVVLSEDVLPACVNWNNKDVRFNPGENATGKLSGFGETETGTLARELQSADLPFISSKSCRQRVSEDFADQITLEKFCAGYESGPGARLGDSGGGLLFVDHQDGRYYLRGVASTREARNSSITTFTDIGLFSPWMKAVVSAANRTSLNEDKGLGSTEIFYDAVDTPSSRDRLVPFSHVKSQL